VRYPIQTSRADLHTTTLGLRFSVTRDHFPAGTEGLAMKLKCTATIASIYWKSNEKSAEGLKQKRGASSSTATDNAEGAGDAGHDIDVKGEDDKGTGKRMRKKTI
jgi:hypothetical protein